MKSKSLTDGEIWVLPLSEKVPRTITVIPEAGGSAEVKTTTSKDVTQNGANWHLLKCTLTGWSNGIASEGAEPCGIYSPITGIMVTATGNVVVEVV